MLKPLTHKEVLERIKAGQTNISTNEDLSEVGYYTYTTRKSGAQVWVLKKYQQAAVRKYQKRYPEKTKRKNGKYQKEHRFELNKYNQTGLRGKRSKIRDGDRRKFKLERKTILFPVDLHHDWINNTAQCRGAAFVERDAHSGGSIKVVKMLYGIVREGEFR